MKAYKIVVAYDGTDYNGWQIQPTMPTIAGTLEQRFKAVFKQDIHIVGASRTDAGVHALGQVARFCSPITLSAEKMLKAWNNLLPRDIVIRKLERIDERFHPQACVLEKTYYYHIFSKRPLPFLARYGFYKDLPFNPTKLEQGLALFVGTHDFRSFTTGYEQENTIRTIHEIKVNFLSRYNAYRITFKGPGFLRYMIRRILGACYDLATSSRSITELGDALIAKNPQQHFFTMPGYGLMLDRISYKID